MHDVDLSAVVVAFCGRQGGRWKPSGDTTGRSARLPVQWRSQTFRAVHRQQTSLFSPDPKCVRVCRSARVQPINTHTLVISFVHIVYLYTVNLIYVNNAKTCVQLRPRPAPSFQWYRFPVSFFSVPPSRGEKTCVCRPATSVVADLTSAESSAPRPSLTHPPSCAGSSKHTHTCVNCTRNVSRRP